MRRKLAYVALLSVFCGACFWAYFKFSSVFCGSRVHDEEVKQERVISAKAVTTESTDIRSDVKPQKIAIVDLKKVAVSSLAGQSIDEQLFTINNEEKKSLVEFEERIKKMVAENKGHDDRKSEDARAMLYEMTRRKRNQIQSAYQVAIETLERNIHEVIQKIAEEQGIDVVLLSDVAVYFKCQDITEDAIIELNKKLPRIPVVLNKEDEMPTTDVSAEEKSHD